LRTARFYLSLGAALVWGCFVHADGRARAEDIAAFHQSEALKQHYPDIPVPMKAPALAPGRSQLTSQEEMLAFLADLSARSSHAAVSMIGSSQQGRDIPLVLLSKEGFTDPELLQKLDRPVVWFIGQQHGNEPAGGEAMLALTAALANGELTPLLDRVTVAIVPRANPDGAANFQRATANQVDPNRDHVLLSTPENVAIHRAMLRLPPDVVFDHHEFSVARRWVEKFGGVQLSDAMILYATHPGVPSNIVALAKDLFKPSIDQAMQAYGLTNILYHTTSYNGADKTVAMGGNAPGIARNTFGLMNSVSFLIETRGVGIGMEDFERRVASHYVIARSVLRTTHDNADRLQQALAQARRSTAAASDDFVVAHRLKQTQLPLPLRDPQSGEEKVVTVTFLDSRQIEPTETRARPAGYAILDRTDVIADRLRLNHVAICRLTQDANVDSQAYAVTGAGAATDNEDFIDKINPKQALQVRLVPMQRSIPAGTVFVTMSQPAASLIAASLEPDSPGSLSGALMSWGDASSPPLLRVNSVKGLRLAPLGDGDSSVCRQD
jgi:hypothetical protein